MKTATQWVEDVVSVSTETGWEYRVTKEQIKQIQLDAFKAGMTRAAEIAHSRSVGKSGPTSKPMLVAREIEKTIHSTRDSLTEKEI
jgi:hypothetical protein